MLFFGPWLINKSKEVVESKKEKFFWLFLMIPNIFQVNIIEEVLVYGPEELIADFGGYLGLLLGASIMSLYDIILAQILMRTT